MPITSAIRKYGIEAFSVETIGYAQTYEQLLELEAEAIKLYGTRSPAGYNVTEGGRGAVGRPCSENTRRRMSELAMGRIPWNKGSASAATLARYARRGNKRGTAKGSKPWNLGMKIGPMGAAQKEQIAATMRKIRAERFWSTRTADEAAIWVDKSNWRRFQLAALRVAI